MVVNNKAATNGLTKHDFQPTERRPTQMLVDLTNKVLCLQNKQHLQAVSVVKHISRQSLCTCRGNDERKSFASIVICREL